MKKITRKLLAAGILAGGIVFLAEGCGQAGKQKSTEPLDSEKQEVWVQKELQFQLPEGFTEAAGREGLYVPGETDAVSCILYAESEAEPQLELLNEDSYEELLEEAYAKLLGMKIQAELTEFYEWKLDGYPAYHMETRILLEDVEYLCTEDLVFKGDKAVSLTFFLNTGEAYSTAFDQCEDSLQAQE